MKNNELENLKKENEQLQLQLQEDEKEDDPEIDSKSFMDGLNKFAEILAPVIDKHFSIAERKLALKEKKAGLNGTQLQGKQAVNELRDDGGVKFNSPQYLAYFTNVYNANDDEMLNYELDLLEQSHPALYQNICTQFNIEEEDGQ